MRVCGLGLSRTGTSSRAAVLKILGYPVKHFPSLRFLDWHFRGPKRRELLAYDAFTGSPVLPIYEQLDAKCPGSKFILSERELEAWLLSRKSYRRFQPTFKASRKARALRRAAYGTEAYSEQHFRAATAKHTADVVEHFADRPGDLLRMDITAGDGWATRCPFLGLPIPDQEFPRLNSRTPSPTNEG